MAEGIEQVGAFHNNCGYNIALLEEGTVAYRKNEDILYGNIVFTKYPINIGELFEVKIEEVDTRWLHSLVSKNLESILIHDRLSTSKRLKD